MADIFDPEPSTLLLCEEECKDLCFDDFDDHHRNHHGAAHKGTNRCFWGPSEPLIHLPSHSEEAFASMVDRENDYLPQDDYLQRLRCSHLDLSARKYAFDWIWKAHSYYDLGPLSFCLAVNYLDRFLSIRELPIENGWAVQLLALSCLSIAAKMEDTNVPNSIDLQVGDPKYVFEPKTIKRMELLLLDSLEWRMNAITPCSFLEHILNKFSDSHLHDKVVNTSMQLIISSIRGIDLLEFKPSEIAVAVAISVSSEIQVVNIDDVMSQFTHLEKERVLKCVEMIKEMPLISRNANVGNNNFLLVSESPIGVLDADCFSYKCDELTTTITTMVIEGSSNGNSCSNFDPRTSSYSPEAKRQKLQTSAPASTSSRMDS